jgi:hypothetical protein
MLCLCTRAFVTYKTNELTIELMQSQVFLLWYVSCSNRQKKCLFRGWDRISVNYPAELRLKPASE